jgi:hypothetical protein
MRILKPHPDTDPDAAILVACGPSTLPREAFSRSPAPIVWAAYWLDTTCPDPMCGVVLGCFSEDRHFIIPIRHAEGRGCVAWEAADLGPVFTTEVLGHVRNLGDASPVALPAVPSALQPEKVWMGLWSGMDRATDVLAERVLGATAACFPYATTSGCIPK